ncbi:helix-turn-helix domain-containing protein [Pseudomonas sp. NGC7]|uniref:helix-turn-helix domain-containing protein n=1 Tax=Pseudomonas sp. NGC7 TaxID=3341775 RepID=UPI00399C7B2E
MTQRDFCDTSRTFLSKLESGKASLTLDKLEKVSQRLEVSSLTLLTLTLSLETGRSSAELVDDLRLGIENLERDGGLAWKKSPTLVACAWHHECDPDGSLRPV